MLQLISKLPLTAKLASVIVSINLIILLTFSAFTWRAQTAESLKAASVTWENSTQQFADLVSGGVKWGKADAVQDAYAIYRDDPKLNLRQFAAFNADGVLVDTWSANDGTAVPDAEALAPATDAAQDKVVIDMSNASDGYVRISVPIARDKKGRPVGSVVTAWATDAIYAAASKKVANQILLQLAAILLTIGAFLFAMRSLVGKPLNKISERINAMQEGDYQASVCYQNRYDEIGIVARALEHFRHQSIEQANQQKLNDENRQSIERERAENSRVMERNATVQQNAVSHLADAMEALAQGDFTIELQDLGAGFEKITKDFNAMIAAVNAALSEVSGASNQVESGSMALAASADQLSSRTEQQAASLEQTAAALSEITVTVKGSTANASEAVSLVSDTKDSAHSSAKLVRDAIGAMSLIQESAGKIGHIIGVVDEIAFQTNLLALNAGVEAARAGDAGKGFAVVAQEVRELAQRSANAAKEIKELVTVSSQHVDSGVKLVNTTGEALASIEEQVKSIDASIRAIVESYSEQSASLQQINVTINHMDQATQQNAAMVEETNAASQELMLQGQALKNSVARFRLLGSASSAAYRTAEAPEPRSRSVAYGANSTVAA